MESFRAFSALHAIALCTIAALTLLAIALRRRRPPEPLAPGPVERTLALAYLGAWIVTYLWLLAPGLREPASTLPLHLCHLAAANAALVLLTGWRPLRALQYFWGLALCTQALITPSLLEGPALYPFWFFWTSHGMIVGVALYDVFARGYRPSWRDWRFACAAAAVYVLAVLPINLAFGWNYGFVGPSRPGVPSIVDFLGPWPFRLVPVVAIAAAAMALLALPWALAARLRPRGSSSA
ncbi:MAG: TIGR02206 family membrane protein [Burkholderiales bacterium]|nr:TIGR02206 family membrane protein [Burkholderiales bacterium]